MAGQAKLSGVVDIVFLLDVTGSMSPCITALKENIATFVDTLVTRGPNNSLPVRDWRAKVVGYRDHEVDAVPFEDAPFVRQADELKVQLGRLVADGGGDEPETLIDALHIIATMGQSERGVEEAGRWRHRGDAARVVVVFTDASYKPTMLRPEAAGGTIDDLRNACEQNRIQLFIFAPDMPCYDALSAMQRTEYTAIPGSNPQQALAEFTRDDEQFRNVLKMLARTVSGSSLVEPVAPEAQ